MSMEPDVIPMTKQNSENSKKSIEVNANHHNGVGTDDEEKVTITENLFQLRITDGIRELQTVIRDK